MRAIKKENEELKGRVKELEEENKLIGGNGGIIIKKSNSPTNLSNVRIN